MHIPISKITGGWGTQFDFFFLKRNVKRYLMFTFDQKSVITLYTYLVTIFNKVFFPSSLLNCGDIISRNVVYECKSWKNKRKQGWTWQDTISQMQTKNLSSRWKIMQHLKQMKEKQIVIKSSFFPQKFDTYFFGE